MPGTKIKKPRVSKYVNICLPVVSFVSYLQLVLQVSLVLDVNTFAVTAQAVILVTIFLEIVLKVVSKDGKAHDVFRKVKDYNFAPT